MLPRSIPVPRRPGSPPVANRAQPGALAGQELGGSGCADAGHPEQSVPQRVDRRELLVGSFP